MIICGNSLNKETFEQINDNSVQSIVTSPPYYLQRDYGHSEQIGLENSIDEYINNLVTVFENIKQKLKEDGTMFINISDTYAGSNKGMGYVDAKRSKHKNTNKIYQKSKQNKECRRKSLMAIPQRFAIAMIQNGWILRNQIIWQKSNAIPDSASDRFTTSYEIILFFSKNEQYKFNTQYELAYTSDTSQPRGSRGVRGQLNGGRRNNDYVTNTPEGQRKQRDVLSISTTGNQTNHFATYPQELAERMIFAGTDVGDTVGDPFTGTSTTGVVALENGREFVGVELVEEYQIISSNNLKKAHKKVPLF